MEVLVVEDEYITAEFIRNSLLELKIENVEITDNSADTLELFTQKTFDLIFMDINIKGTVDGLELASILYLKYDANIIFITSYQDSTTIHEASLSKPLGYLIKPVTKSEIESILMVAKNLLQKTHSNSNTTKQIANYSFDLQYKNLSDENGDIKLSKLESEVMYLLVKNINNVVHNELLYHYLWNEPRSSSTLRELIYRLRKKVPNLTIEKYSNIGYTLKEG